MKLLVFLTSLSLAGSLLAAPDEDLLGKKSGYPVCAAPPGRIQPHCLVGTYSRWDEVAPSNKVARGAKVRELKRATAELDVYYDYAGRENTLPGFLARNRNTGLLILQGDTILAEQYQYDRTPEHRFASMSMAKTVVAMLVGIAMEEGFISSLDNTPDLYIPELKGHPYGETPLRHLLTMSSGVRFVENYDGADHMAVLARKTYGHQGPGGVDSVLPFSERVLAPGEKFSYSSAETQVLGLVLRAATGRTLAEYLSEKIWRPMGAEADATWLVDAGGYEIAYSGLNATLRDWGRFGLLLADGGAVDGRQIIPAAWVKAATTAAAPHLAIGRATRFNGYGYQTWVLDGEGRFALLGVRGQGIFVDPAARVVVVHTAVHSSARESAPRGEQYALFYGALRALKDD